MQKEEAKEKDPPKTLAEWQEEVHALARQKGWYAGPERTRLENHMLIVSEIAEATEAVRRGEPLFYKTPEGKPEGEMAELADAVIRVMDYFECMGWSLEDAIREKHTYNKTRPYRHGGKLL